MKKKYAWLIIIAFIAIFVTAATESAAGEDTRVVYLTKSMGSDYFVLMSNYLEEVCIAQGWTFSSLDANMDMETELKNMETAITQGIDLIFLNAVDSQGALVPIMAASEAGIPVIVLDAAVTEEAPYVTTVSAANLENGIASGRYLARTKFPDINEPIRSVHITSFLGNIISKQQGGGLIQGIIMERTGMDFDTAAAAMDTMWSELNNIGNTKNEQANYEILGMGVGRLRTNESQTVFEDLLTTFPNINAVTGETDSMLLGAYNVTNDQGLSDTIWMAASGSGNRQGCQAILDGTNYLATGLNSPKAIVRKSVEIAKEILEGKPWDQIERLIRTDPQAITIENVEEYLNNIDDYW